MTSTGNSDGWIEWHGGENPVPGKVVECRLAATGIPDMPPIASECMNWAGDIPGAASIIAYRVVTPTTALEGPHPCQSCGPGVRTGLPGNACENCMGTGEDPEASAWAWVQSRYPNDAASDLAFDADEMVDAYIAGATARRQAALADDTQVGTEAEGRSAPNPQTEAMVSVVGEDRVEMVADLIEKYTYVMSRHNPAMARVAGLNSCATEILKALSAIEGSGGALQASPSVPTEQADGAVVGLERAWEILAAIPAINDLGSQYQEDIQAAILTALQSGRDADTLATLLDNVVIAQSLSRDLREQAHEAARSYLYNRRQIAAARAGEKV